MIISVLCAMKRIDTLLEHIDMMTFRIIQTFGPSNNSIESDYPLILLFNPKKSYHENTKKNFDLQYGNFRFQL